MKTNLIRNYAKKITAAALALALTLTLLPASAADTAYAASVSKVTGISVIDRDDDEVRLSWQAAAGASGYEVYRYSNASSTWILIGRTDSNTYEAEDLLSASVYTFKVRAYTRDGSGNVTYGAYSDSFKTCTSPKDVDELYVQAKTTSSVTLDWSSVRRADKYQVYQYNRTTRDWERVITTSKTKYKVTGLKSGTTYKFKVRSYRSALGQKYYSDFESVTVTTRKSSSSGSSGSSGLIGTSKAKSIALGNAGVSASAASFTKVELDYDDGIHVYEIEFISGDYEYEYEINASTGKIVSYDRESAWD